MTKAVFRPTLRQKNCGPLNYFNGTTEHSEHSGATYYPKERWKKSQKESEYRTYIQLQINANA